MSFFSRLIPSQATRGKECAAAEAPAELTHFGMGTTMTHRAYGPRAKEALEAVREEASRLEGLWSRFLPESEISSLNACAGQRSVPVIEPTYRLLELAGRVSELSGGLFDITIAPLADLWDYKHASVPPPEERIGQVLPLVCFRDLELSSSNRSAYLKKSGQAVDLGGIGKGFASDLFLEVFKKYGVVSAFSNIGGNVATLGSKPDGSAWTVGIRHPRSSGLIGTVAVTGKAVVTSGDYERYFTGRDGKRCHHILNPKTGYPAHSGLLSVTVAAQSAALADALSTAIFVAGPDSGLALLDLFPEAEAVLIDEELRIIVTGGLKNCFRASDACGIT